MFCCHLLMEYGVPYLKRLIVGHVVPQHCPSNVLSVPMVQQCYVCQICCCGASKYRSRAKNNYWCFFKAKRPSVNFWTISFNPEFLIIFDEACPQVWFHLKARQTISELHYYRCSMHFLPECYRDFYLYSNNKLLYKTRKFRWGWWPLIS